MAASELTRLRLPRPGGNDNSDVGADDDHRQTHDHRQRSGQHDHRCLAAVPHFDMTSGDVTLNSLTLKNGRVANGPGGAIHSTSSGRLTINLSTLADNSTTAYGQGGGAITDMYVGGRPTIVAPVAGSSSSNQTPTFTWRPVDGAARYMLQVDRLDAAQSKVIFKTDLTSTSFTATTALPAGTYRAWVQAVSTTGQFSPWSLQLDFTIGTTTSMIDSPDPDLHLTGLLVSELAQGDARDANGHESQMIDQKQPDPVTDEDDVEVAVPAPSSGPSVWPANNDQQPDLLDLDRWMMEFAVREFLPGQR